MRPVICEVKNPVNGPGYSGFFTYRMRLAGQEFMEKTLAGQTKNGLLRQSKSLRPDHDDRQSHNDECERQKLLRTDRLLEKDGTAEYTNNGDK